MCQALYVVKHFTHETAQNGHMRLYKIPEEFQLADLLTKALQVQQFESCLLTLVGCKESLILRRGGETDL